MFFCEEVKIINAKAGHTFFISQYFDSYIPPPNCRATSPEGRVEKESPNPDRTPQISITKKRKSVPGVPPPPKQELA